MTTLEEVVATAEYDRRARTIDGRFSWLDSQAQVWSNAGKLSTAIILAWRGELNRWRSWFHANVEDTPVMPWQTTGELEAFDRSVTDWRARLETESGGKLVQPEWQKTTPDSGTGLTDGLGDGIAKTASSLATAVVTVAVVGTACALLLSLAKSRRR